MRARAKTLVHLGVALVCVLAVGAAAAASAGAQSTWRLEQPSPPSAPPGVSEAPAPVGLGRIGDIEFWAPNRGLLITAGNPPTIPAGVWAYNGQRWHELATVCGASDGRIAWADPDEFWTISNGRPGQAEVNEKTPPLADNTLCRFAGGAVTESFAAPAFEANSYQAMHAAGCLSAEDCWFAGNALPQESTQVGTFQLHWNGSTLAESPYPAEGHAVEDMRAFDGRLYSSTRLLQSDPVQSTEAVPPALHVLDPEHDSAFVAEEELGRETLYAEEERPWALGYLHLSAGPGALWATTGQEVEEVLGEPKATEHQQVTVLRFTPEAGGEWKQLLGPRTAPSGEDLFPEQTVEAVAAEPGAEEEQAWLALQTLKEAKATTREQEQSSARAMVAQISAGGVVSQTLTLPSAEEGGVGPKGAAYKLACPAPGDCWLVTTTGWLFHLAPEGERTLPEDTDPNFAGVITERPPDQGLPQTDPDSLPPDDSGLAGEDLTPATIPKLSKPREDVRVPVALLSKLHTRLVHGTTLELRFHLAVKARIQLIAKRKHRVVAKTRTYTFAAGNRKLLLRLDRAHWPTELHLVEHPLAPLPTVSTRESGTETVTTSLAFPAHLLSGGLGLLG